MKVKNRAALAVLQVQVVPTVLEEALVETLRAEAEQEKLTTVEKESNSLF